MGLLSTSQVIVLLTGHCWLAPCHTLQYSFVSDNQTWTEAQSYCRENSGTLATASSLEDLEELTKAATDNGYYGDFWIGLYDDVDNWQWSLGSRGDGGRSEGVTFWNWYDGEPLDFKLENCVALSNGGVWESWVCEAKQKFICYDEGESNPYIPINMIVNFKEAQSYCRTHHTDLVSVRNQTENGWILDIVLTLSWSRTWIGLFRNGWRWTDADGTAFHNWTSDQPVKGAQSCGLVSVSNGGRVENQWCDNMLPFACRFTVMQKTFRLKLQAESEVDMADPAVQTAIMEQIQQRLLERGLPAGNLRLSWKKQHDGQIFQEEKEEDNKRMKREIETN